MRHGSVARHQRCGCLGIWRWRCGRVVVGRGGVRCVIEAEHPNAGDEEEDSECEQEPREALRRARWTGGRRRGSGWVGPSQPMR